MFFYEQRCLISGVPAMIRSSRIIVGEAPVGGHTQEGDDDIVDRPGNHIRKDDIKNNQNDKHTADKLFHRMNLLFSAPRDPFRNQPDPSTAVSFSQFNNTALQRTKKFSFYIYSIPPFISLIQAI